MTVFHRILFPFTVVYLSFLEFTVCFLLSLSPRRPYGEQTLSPVCSLLHLPSLLSSTHTHSYRNMEWAKLQGSNGSWYSRVLLGGWPEQMSLCFSLCPPYPTLLQHSVSRQARASLWALWQSTMTKTYSHIRYLLRISISVVSVWCGQN